MAVQKFKLWHSMLGLTLLVIGEGALIRIAGSMMAPWYLCGIALIGVFVNMYVAMEVIEDIQNATRMLLALSAVVAEFIIFFSFQYGYLLSVQRGSFPTLSSDPVSLALHSTMVFVFNPLNTPGTTLGQVLLLVNIAGALILVMFILQNVSQLRRKSSE